MQYPTLMVEVPINILAVQLQSKEQLHLVKKLGLLLPSVQVGRNVDREQRISSRYSISIV
jgi:hypothetical protein